MTRASDQAGVAVFLDRDGVINEPVWDELDERYESPLDPRHVALANGAAAAIAALQSAGWRTVVVSNQPAAAKGKATRAQLRAVHARVVSLLAESGVRIETWRYCLHHPQAVVPGLGGACDCRKPKAGMLLDAAAREGIDLRRSWMVGDSDVDVAAGAAAGCQTVMVEAGASAHRRSGPAKPDARVRDLRAAAALIGPPLDYSVSVPQR